MITLLAKITFYTDTVRHHPILSGYKPGFAFENVKTTLSGLIKLLDVEELKPGETGNIHVTFVEGIIDDKYLKPQVRFYFNEAIFRLGEGEFLEIVKKWN